MAPQLSIQDIASETVAVKDATISSSGSYLGRGTATVNQIGKVAGKGGTAEYRTLIYIAVGGRVPKGAIVKSATLRVNVTVGGGSGMGIDLKFLASDWTEDSSFPTWSQSASGTDWDDTGASGSADTIAAFGTNSLGLAPSSTGDVDFDVTKSVKYAIERNSGVWNVILQTDNEETSPELVKFKSGDDSTEADRPELIIQYVQGGGGAAKVRSASIRASSRRGLAKRQRNKIR